LYLGNNILSSLDVTNLPNLVILFLNQNNISDFNSISGLTSNLINIDFGFNSLTSINVSSLTGLTSLALYNNLLTNIDITGLSNLITLYLQDNPITPEANDSILDTLELNGLEYGNFQTFGGRTAAGTSDYNTLISRNWAIQGADLVGPPSTSRRVGIRRRNP
jgi:Leucine-rich repeat (LRR) protein